MELKNKIEAAWADARTRMTDVGRLGALLDRATQTMVHRKLTRISPLAVPVMAIIGRESVAQGAADDQILFEAETLARAAMQADQVLDDGNPKPGPRLFCHIGAADASKGFAQVGDFRLGNADALVPDLDLYGIAAAGNPYPSTLARGGKLDGVGNKVLHDLLDGAAVGLYGGDLSHLGHHQGDAITLGNPGQP